MCLALMTGAYKGNKSDRPFTGDLLVFDIFACKLKNIEEAREQIQIIIWDEADFFGNIPDTYMGFRHSKSSDNENIILYGFTKIDTDYVFVSIFFISQYLGNEDLELYKKMMEDYFLKLRKVNSSPLVTYEREPPEKPAEKCVIPGGASVSDEGETIFIFRDCTPHYIIKKKVPVPAGFTIVQDDPKYPSRFEFVSDVKTWEEFNKKKDGEHFYGNLVIFNVRKFIFDNNQEAYDEIEHLFMGIFGEFNTFGDLPNTNMAYSSYHLSTCSAILMGNTKIFDEYVQVFMHVWHGCSPDSDDADVYKKMMIDYFQKIRNINYKSYLENNKYNYMQ
ncbi:MAG: hypothetical protein LBP92_00425 [Deltaproteobacteria bacterium]|nr:hypothetical protein [Deltaproteobacteria bacterium]